MQVFKLVKQLTGKYNSIIGKKIGDGADGEVYSIRNDNTKVIKFSVHYLWEKEDIKKTISEKLEAFSQVQSNPNLFAKLYEYSYIGQNSRHTIQGEQDYLLFSYIMEKCNKITVDESKVFHSLISHEDNNLSKDYSIDHINKMLDGLSRGLDFSKSKVIEFITLLKSSSVKYTDIHPRNIMKDYDGNFKFIDFDRISV